jgi:hypothetical protein
VGKSTWHEAPTLPVDSLHAETGVGASVVVLSSKICRLPLGATGVSLKCSQHPNIPIGSAGSYDKVN